MGIENEDIETALGRVLEEYWRLRSDRLPVYFERVSLSSPLKNRPKFCIKTKKSGLTGAHCIAVYDADLWEEINSRISDKRNAHCQEFGRLCEEYSALRPLEDTLAFLYEALHFLGFDEDLRQVGDFGRPANWSGEEDEKWVFFAPEHYQGVLSDNPSEDMTKFAHGSEVKAEFENPKIWQSAQRIGPFSAFLMTHSPETTHRLIGEIWQDIGFCVQAVRNNRPHDILINALHVGISTERLSWKLKHEAAAIASHEQKQGREMGGAIRGEQLSRTQNTGERLTAMKKLVAGGKGINAAAAIVSKRIGGTEAANRKLWTRDKKVET